jgi:hypothetical protein
MAKRQKAKRYPKLGWREKKDNLKKLAEEAFNLATIVAPRDLKTLTQHDIDCAGYYSRVTVRSEDTGQKYVIAMIIMEQN